MKRRWTQIRGRLSAAVAMVRRRQAGATQGLLWLGIELAGYGVLCAAFFDVWRPLGLLAVGLVLIRLGDSRGRTRPAGRVAAGGDR